jgi:hypothetical protein
MAIASARFGNYLEVQAEGLRSATSKPAPFGERKSQRMRHPKIRSVA